MFFSKMNRLADTFVANSTLFSRQNITNKDIEITNKENAGVPTTTQNVNVTISVVACSLSRRQVWPESNRKFYCYHFVSKLRIIIIIIMIKTAQPTARALVQHYPRLHVRTPVHRERAHGQLLRTGSLHIFTLLYFVFFYFVFCE